MAEMTVKERLLGAIRGTEIDRVPWSPNLTYYFGELPESVWRKGVFPYLQEMGADPLLRGDVPLYQMISKNCERTTVEKGRKRYEIYETPVGTLTEEYTYSPDANSWFLSGHPVKEEEDFKILQYIYENMQVVPDYDAFEKEYREVGENGLMVPTIEKTAFQQMLEQWCGTIELVYALTDYPETVEECLAVMQKRNMECVRISAENVHAEGFISWEDTSTTNISPEYFTKYIGSEIRQWTKEIHDKGKFYVHHACGHIKDLLTLMADTKIDMIDALTPPPTGNVEVKEAVSVLPDSVGIIGGIDPAFLLNSTMEELEAYIRELLDTTRGKRFILANSDSCPPGVAYEKFLLARDLVHGKK